MNFSSSVASRTETPSRSGRAVSRVTIRKPLSRFSDIWKAALHDFPIRDEILYQYLPLSSDMDVLEIGPGSGFTALRLARQVRCLTLVDIAAENITQLRESLGRVPNVKLLHADVCSPSLPETVGEQFDVIFGLEVFEYLAEPGVCLKNLAALLRKGGTLVLEFPNYPPPKSPGITHFKRREELNKLLHTAGFESWNVFALKLRPHARMVFRYLHEHPLRVFRFLLGRNAQGRAMTYDQTWAFRHQKSLERQRYILHAAWALLSAAMRLGGDCFRRTILGIEILNHDLLVVARR